MARQFAIINIGQDGESRSLLSYETKEDRDFAEEWNQTNSSLHDEWNTTDTDPEVSTTDDIINYMSDALGWDITVEDFLELEDNG